MVATLMIEFRKRALRDCAVPQVRQWHSAADLTARFFDHGLDSHGVKLTMKANDEWAGFPGKARAWWMA
jgi:hypothetical protein